MNVVKAVLLLLLCAVGALAYDGGSRFMFQSIPTGANFTCTSRGCRDEVVITVIVLAVVLIVVYSAYHCAVLLIRSKAYSAMKQFASH